MALYLLNISVDTVDSSPEDIPEDLNINDQESIVEIVVEKILGFENAIEEYDDHDTEEHNKKSTSKVDLVNHFSKENQESNLDSFSDKQKYGRMDTDLRDGYHQCYTPPPRV